MHRHTLLVSAMLWAFAGSMPVAAQNVANYKYGMAPSPRSNDPSYRYPPQSIAVDHDRLNARGTDQVLRWGKLGQCVTATDRQASLSYVNAQPGSSAATIAAQRLDPAFAACFARSGIVDRTNAAIRRAALADALKVNLARGS